MMSNNSLHINAKGALKKRLEKILFNYKVSKGILDFDDSVYADIYAYKNEVKKHKKEWIDDIKIYSILYRRISDYVSDTIKNRWETSGDLKNIIGDKGIEDVSNRIIAYLESIPRRYFVYFELPSVKGIGLKEIKLTDNVSLVEKVNEDDFPEIKIPASGLCGTGLLGLYGNYSLRKGQLYIRVQTDGYADETLESGAVKKAYSKFKQLVFLAKTGKLFVERKEAISFGLLGLRVPQLFVTSESEKYLLNLPQVVSNYISKMEINEDELEPNKYKIIFENFENKDALTPNDKAKILKERLQHAVKLLQISDEDENVKPIKTAIEWAFDSLTNDNETVAFIQACIGLEAILGDEEEEPQKSLQNKLADRCAYLLGKNFTERKKIREDFIKLYKTRSKLIHGRKAELDKEQKNFLRFSQRILDRIIWKEISYIKLSKNTYRERNLKFEI